MNTFSYKGHYIHENFTNSTVEVQFKNNIIIKVKSVHAAKILITKHEIELLNEFWSWQQ